MKNTDHARGITTKVCKQGGTWQSSSSDTVHRHLSVRPQLSGEPTWSLPQEAQFYFQLLREDKAPTVDVKQELWLVWIVELLARNIVGINILSQIPVPRWRETEPHSLQCPGDFCLDGALQIHPHHHPYTYTLLRHLISRPRSRGTNHFLLNFPTAWD